MVGGVQWVTFISGGEGVFPPLSVVAPRYHPASSCSRQVFGVLLVVVIALSWSSWSGSWACATTEPPHEQGLVAVVGVGQGVRVPVVNIIFISRKKKRNKEKKLTYGPGDVNDVSWAFFWFCAMAAPFAASSSSSGWVLGHCLVILNS